MIATTRGGAVAATRRKSFAIPHASFAAAELLLVMAAAALALLVKAERGPLPSDVNIILGEQHLLLPHHRLTQALDLISQINWPVPAGIVVGVVFVGLLLLRRWLDGLTALFSSVLGDLSSYLVNQFVQRPRPQGYGIAITKQITNYFSFPSGHVVHVLAFFAVLLFLSWRVRRLTYWLAPLQVVLVLLVVLIGPSRVLEGEHWPSDVVEGLLMGGFWLMLAIHAFLWAGQRWPRLLAADERDPAQAAPSAGEGDVERTVHGGAT